MLKAMAPVRDKLIELQRDGKITLISYNWGFKNREGVFITIEFDINETRNTTRSYICRTFTGRMMDGAVMQALSLLNDVK